MRVPNTTVTVSDTPDGVAIAFTTTSDATELRSRVHHMAEMHQAAQTGGMRNPMTLIPSTATVENIDSGARIVLTPKDRSQLDVLRSQVRAHADRMAHGHCPMMEM